MSTVIELLTRILCDTRPGQSADGAYLFCTTIHNQASICQSAGILIKQLVASQILILDAQAMNGYPGVIQCRERLQDFGLAREQINYVPLEETTSVNTLIESEALVRFARGRKLGSLVVVSPPFHQLRVFMTVVTVVLRRYPELSIYSYPGAAMPWMEAAVHSQGTLQAPRRQLIQEELIRIDTYQEKGDLAQFEDVLDYLNHRDR